MSVETRARIEAQQARDEFQTIARPSLPEVLDRAGRRKRRRQLGALACTLVVALAVTGVVITRRPAPRRGTLTAGPSHNAPLALRIEAPKKTMRTGTTMPVTLVIGNHTGAPLRLTDQNGCGAGFAVVLGNDIVPPIAAFRSLCGSPLLIPVGETRFPFTIRATYPLCSETGHSQGTAPVCRNGFDLPPLPPGDYQVSFADDGSHLPAPSPVTVRVTADPNDAATRTAVVAGGTGGNPPCAPSQPGTYGADPAHPERAPLQATATFADGVAWAICGASQTGDGVVLNLRTTNHGRAWTVTNTGLTFSVTRPGDQVNVALSAAEVGQVHIHSPLPPIDTTYTTRDGGRTWHVPTRDNPLATPSGAAR
jgi:hypothetical protein